MYTIQGPILKLRVKVRINAEYARPTLVFGPMKQPEPHGAPGVLAKTKSVGALSQRMTRGTACPRNRPRQTIRISILSQPCVTPSSFLSFTHRRPAAPWFLGCWRDYKLFPLFQPLRQLRRVIHDGFLTGTTPCAHCGCTYSNANMLLPSAWPDSWTGLSSPGRS